MEERKFVMCDKAALVELQVKGKDFMEALDSFVKESVGGPELRRIEVPHFPRGSIGSIVSDIDRMLGEMLAGRKSADRQPTGFEAIARDLRAGNASKYHVGDCFTTQHNELGQIEWHIIGINEEELTGEKRPHVTVQAKKILTYRQFNAPTKAFPYGHNAWMGSDIREWLNHDFLDGMPFHDQMVLASCKKKTHTPEGVKMNDERCFLLSASEIGFNVNNDAIHDEGNVYSYYADAIRKIDPEEPLRKKLDTDGDEAAYWLRSPYPWNAVGVRGVNPDGSLGIGNAFNGYGAAPACVIA